MVACNYCFLIVVCTFRVIIKNKCVFGSVVDKFGNFNDVKILPKKYVIDVTQDKAQSNSLHITHNIPIDGTYNILQTKPSRSRVSIALNAARGCKVKVEIDEANEMSGKY